MNQELGRKEWDKLGVGEEITGKENDGLSRKKCE